MSILDESAASGASVLDPISSFIKNPFKQKVINKERGPDFPRGFFIIEYINDMPQPDPLELIGNMMPHQPFVWDGEQRMVSEYYPGNPEPTIQLMGSKEGTVTIQGRFKDKRLQAKNPAFAEQNIKDPYGTAYQFSLAVDELRKRGNLLFFGMGGPVASWTRYGFMEKCEFKMNKLSWVDYSITFMVVGEERPTNNFFSADQKDSPTQLNQAMIAAATAFNATYSSVPASVPQSLADVINGVVNGIAKNINLVTNFVDTIINAVSDVEKAGFRALGLIKNAKAKISSYRRQIGAITFSSSALSSEKSTVGKFVSSQNTIAYLSAISSAMGVLSLQLSQMREQVKRLSVSSPLVRYSVVSGDTLQNIAMKFYGAFGNWGKIYDHNKLTTTVLTPGQILEIPKL